MLLNSETNSGKLKNVQLFVASRWRVWRLLSHPRAPLNEGVSSSLFESCGICEHTGAIKKTLRGGNLFPIHYPGFFFFYLIFSISTAACLNYSFTWEGFSCRCCLLKSRNYTHSRLLTLTNNGWSVLPCQLWVIVTLEFRKNQSNRNIFLLVPLDFWPFTLLFDLIYVGHPPSKRHVFYLKPKTRTKIGIMCHTVNNYLKYQL